MLLTPDDPSSEAGSRRSRMGSRARHDPILELRSIEQSLQRPVRQRIANVLPVALLQLGEFVFAGGDDLQGDAAHLVEGLASPAHPLRGAGGVAWVVRGVVVGDPD